MILKLKGLLDEIVYFVELDDSKRAMEAMERFVLLFDSFLNQNKSYIFPNEIQELNYYLSRIMMHMEENNLGKLVEIIQKNLRGLLEDWDFNNKSIN
jgi:hypothetical protein